MPSMPDISTSYWIATAPARSYPTLEGDHEVDVAVIGGGITGITAAALLERAGKRVALIEAQKVAQGVTGYTTAHLTEAIDTRYGALTRDFGLEGARLAAQASRAAIDRIAGFVAEKSIHCAWRRLPGYLYSEREDDLEALHHEFEAAKRLGLAVSMTDDVPLPFPTRAAVRFANQAEFHVRAYLLPLCEEIVERGGRVFEDSRVVDFEEGDVCRVVTDRGAVRAKQVVVAANVPLNRVLLQTKLSHYRSYVLALRVSQPKLEGLFWDTDNPYHYLRSAAVDGGSESVLLVGGEDHKTGTVEHTEACYERLLDYAGARFDVQEVGFRWSAQVIETVDGLPLIGPNAKSSRVFVATGYSGNGMTFGTAAAMILSDLVLGKSNPFAELFDPARIKPVAAARDFVVDNAEVGLHFVADRLRSADTDDVHDVAPGQGKIVRMGGKRLAVFRDASGKLHGLSPVCPHLGCHVHFNDAEATWDCPCHGSRFDTDGKVLNGPSLRGLEPVAIDSEGGRAEAKAKM
jgi:glycine/D-amino acid oxidase-like deaminating enzyme/nitrite reductase/ring-hydroxylating ferredoxin subunit